MSASDYTVHFPESGKSFEIKTGDSHLFTPVNQVAEIWLRLDARSRTETEEELFKICTLNLRYALTICSVEVRPLEAVNE